MRSRRTTTTRASCSCPAPWSSRRWCGRCAAAFVLLLLLCCCVCAAAFVLLLLRLLQLCWHPGVSDLLWCKLHAACAHRCRHAAAATSLPHRQDPPLPWVIGDPRILNPGIHVGSQLDRLVEGEAAACFYNAQRMRASPSVGLVFCLVPAVWRACRVLLACVRTCLPVV